MNWLPASALDENAREVFNNGFLQKIGLDI
jgi:hypothetical protein